MLSHAQECHVEAVARFGLHAGIAFQIADDLLDITGDEAHTGKTGRRDAAKDKLTLAVIHLLDTLEETERSRVQEMLDSGGEFRRELTAMLRRAGSLQYAHERAGQYVLQAIEALAELPAGEARDALAQTARFMADRKL